ncbi:hypothetical protein VIGAN_11015500 [Vigna angularis var. angularis]|uniref:Uncharacterized protein n=1 Tax=Vigna angularis var. angularis TaxID=157739 RepID=A0A0S3T7L2_PHAAN|nr:hypothetical protein VIGAN_11015500 [Vigna angularis var. angularis]
MAAELVGGALLSAFLQVAFDRLAFPQFLDFFRGRKLDHKLLDNLKIMLHSTMLSLMMQNRSSSRIHTLKNGFFPSKRLSLMQRISWVNMNSPDAKWKLNPNLKPLLTRYQMLGNSGICSHVNPKMGTVRKRRNKSVGVREN